MAAHDQTRGMIAWWREVGVDRMDLAMRRRDGTMLWTHDIEASRLPLAWAGRENAHGADIYIRPARGASWPIVFLDDLALDRAHRAADRYDVLAVHTSPQGGCHLWLCTAELLDEAQRRACQRYLAERTAADMASTSGEHLGRLAGFRNWKRGGCWINALRSSRGRGPWRPPAAVLDAQLMKRRSWSAPRCSSSVDRSPSGRDWAMVCAACERGVPADVIVADLVVRCRDRRGADAERYARFTVERAMRRR